MSKSISAICAVTLGLSVASVTAKDTAEDVQLREALRQKMSEMGGAPQTPAAPAKPAPAPAPAKPAPAPAPAKPAAPVKAPEPAPAPAKAPEPVAAPVAQPISKPAPQPAVRASEPVVLQPAGQDDEEAAKMREAMRARMEAQPTQPAVAAPAVVATPAAPAKSAAPAIPVAPAPAAPETKPAPAKTTVKASDPEYKPVVAPPPPVTGTKEQRLQQLLQQYKADQITPMEYHTQRAKIIAE